MKTKVGINGFGRIGRNAFKAALAKNADFEIVAINDITNPATLAHLLKYDSCFGRFDGTVEAKADAIVVNGKEVKILAVRNPEELPWKEMGVEVVLESTGLFTKKADAEKHIKQARRRSSYPLRRQMKTSRSLWESTKTSMTLRHITYYPMHPARQTVWHRLQR